MKWLMDNWSLLVVIVAAFACVTVYLKKFSDAPTEEQVAKIKEWLLYAVLEAEAQFGSGTGQLKLRYVYDLFITRFPDLVKIVSFEMFSKWVDEVLKEMRHLIETNLDITYYVGLGGDK